MRTRIFTWLFMLLVPALCWANEEPPTEAIDGKTFYLLDSKEDLEWFRDYVNEGHPGACAKLTDNINLNPNFTFSEDGYSGSGTPEEWEPIIYMDITTSEVGYKGIFDGNGHSISGLYIKEKSALIYKGLFGFVGSMKVSYPESEMTDKNAIVQNLTVEGYIECYNNERAGGIAGFNVATIQNCTNKVYLLGTLEEESPTFALTVGGICSTNSGTIKGCINEGNIKSIDITGGICASNLGTIEKCYNKGTISSGERGNTAIGGIAGEANRGQTSYINNCYNVGTLNTTEGNVAGICPVLGNYTTMTTHVTIANCHNYGKITGDANKAGICTVPYEGDINVVVSNNYYLASNTDAGFLYIPRSPVEATIPNDQPGQTEAKSADAFANGEVLALLQNNNPGVWTQGEKYPVFVAEGETPTTVYTITFDYNYEGSEPDYQYALEGSNKTVEFPKAPTREDYTFLGWSETQDGSIINTSTPISITEDKTYYAQWQAEQTEEPEQPGDEDEDQGNTGIHKPQRPIKYYNIYIDTICPGLDVEVSKDVVQEGHQVSAYLTIQSECDTTGMRFEYKRGLFGYWQDLKALEGVQPGEYIIKNIYTDIYIRALDATLPEEEPTGIENLEGVKAYAKDGSIYVYTPNREEVTIISMSGAIIKNEEQVGLQSYSVSRGIYIVRIGEKVFKLKN